MTTYPDKYHQVMSPAKHHISIKESVKVSNGARMSTNASPIKMTQQYDRNATKSPQKKTYSSAKRRSNADSYSAYGEHSTVQTNVR